MSALGALEIRIHATGDDGTRSVVLHLAGESSTLGAEVVVTLDEVPFEVVNLQNLPWLKRDPELSRTGHLHHNATTRKERCLSPTNLEGADVPSVETLTTNLYIQGLIPDPVSHPSPRFQEKFDTVSHFCSPPFRLGMYDYSQTIRLITKTTLAKMARKVKSKQKTSTS